MTPKLETPSLAWAVRHACYRIGGLAEARDPEGALTKALLAIRNELEDALKTFAVPEAAEIDEHALMTMVRVYHGFKTDAAMVDTLGYSLELYEAKMRQALQAVGITPPQLDQHNGRPK